MKYDYIGDLKYRNKTNLNLSTDIIPPKEISTEYIKLSLTGQLFIKKGFCWDGATGAFDTQDFMRGSMTHDAFCNLIAGEYLPQSYRKDADKLLRKMLIEDGMSKIRAWWVYHTIRLYVKAAY